jgi:hypothetical protein
LRLDTGRIWVPLFMMTGISILSGSAGVQTGGWSFTGIDKLAHFLVFGLLGIAWARVFPAASFPAARRLFLATGLTFLFGLLDELHQYRNPLRTFEWADLAADLAGGLAWSALYIRVGAMRELMEIEFRQVLRLRSSGRHSKSEP